MLEHSRKLRTIKESYNKFVQQGKSVKSKAALYLSVIHKPLWDITVSSVCPPYLHILLGVVNKHHDFLEDACNKIDFEIAKLLAASDYETQEEFDKLPAYSTTRKLLKI